MTDSNSHAPLIRKDELDWKQSWFKILFDNCPRDRYYLFTYCGFPCRFKRSHTTGKIIMIELWVNGIAVYTAPQDEQLNIIKYHLHKQFKYVDWLFNRRRTKLSYD